MKNTLSIKDFVIDEGEIKSFILSNGKYLREISKLNMIEIKNIPEIEYCMKLDAGSKLPRGCKRKINAGWGLVRISMISMRAIPNGK